MRSLRLNAYTVATRSASVVDVALKSAPHQQDPCSELHKVCKGGHSACIAVVHLLRRKPDVIDAVQRTNKIEQLLRNQSQPSCEPELPRWRSQQLHAMLDLYVWQSQSMIRVHRASIVAIWRPRAGSSVFSFNH